MFKAGFRDDIRAVLPGLTQLVPEGNETVDFRPC